MLGELFKTQIIVGEFNVSRSNFWRGLPVLVKKGVWNCKNTQLEYVNSEKLLRFFLNVKRRDNH